MTIKPELVEIIRTAKEQIKENERKIEELKLKALEKEKEIKAIESNPNATRKERARANGMKSELEILRESISAKEFLNNQLCN